MVKVLFVGCDGPEDAELIARFKRLGAQALMAPSADAAIEIVWSERPDAVVVRGRERVLPLSRRLEANNKFTQPPVLSLGKSASADDASQIKDAAARPSIVDERELLERVRSLSRIGTMRAELRRRLATLGIYGSNYAKPMPTPPESIELARCLLVSTPSQEAKRITDVIRTWASVEHLTDAANALEHLERTDFDCVVVADLGSPATAIDFCQRVRAVSRFFHLPLHLIANANGAGHGADLSREAVEVLYRPWSPEELRARMEESVRQHRLRRAMLAIFSAARPAPALDGLTGLFNFGFLMQHLGSQVAEARSEKRGLTVGVLRIAGLELLNKRYGYAGADLLLRQVGLVIGRLIRSEDLAARTTGGEFVVVLPDTDVDLASVALQRLASVVENTDFGVGQPAEAVRVGFHIGAAEWVGADSAESLLARARELAAN